jgi:hypothetical protein
MDSYLNDIEWKTIMQKVDVLMQVSTYIGLQIIYIKRQIWHIVDTWGWNEIPMTILIECSERRTKIGRWEN